MRKAILTILMTGAALAFGLTAQAGGPHPIAQPYGSSFELGVPSYPVERDRAQIPIDHLVLGAEHILDQQCHNGGFGWPHNTCVETKQNITAPILLGVLGTYYFGRDDSHLVGAINGGAFALTYMFDNGEARFPTFTPVFLRDLALAADNTSFSTFVSIRLFDELAAGTYSPGDFDTAGWIADIQADRSPTYVNLLPWDFHTLIPAARALGQPGQDDLFEQGVLDGLATLDNSDSSTVPSDIIGLAGAVRGLAFARRMTFPAIVAPNHPGVNGIDNLEDLAAYLRSLQNPNGSWYWHSNLGTPIVDDEDVQTTAYAALALLDADVITAFSHPAVTQAARDWMVSMQLPDGGFPEYPGGDENTEVEGEALTAVAYFDSIFFVDGFESGDTILWETTVP